MPHDHASHGPSHAGAGIGRAFAIGSAANGAFVVLQLVMGWHAGSTALVADALHNLSDVLGLLLSWGAVALGQRRPSSRYTYGWGRSSVLAALANALMLLFGSGAIALEAVQRIGSPVPAAADTMIWVAALGIVINGSTALLFLRGRAGDLNIQGAFLHLAADALISLGVLAAGILIALTGWAWVDPVASLAIVAVVTWGTWGLMRQSTALAMDAVPPGIDPDRVKAGLEALSGVSVVHHLHVWALSTTRTALTAHLVSETAGIDLAQEAAKLLRRDFGIGHATIQIDRPLRPVESPVAADEPHART